MFVRMSWTKNTDFVQFFKSVLRLLTFRHSGMLDSTEQALVSTTTLNTNKDHVKSSLVRYLQRTCGTVRQRLISIYRALNAP